MNGKLEQLARFIYFFLHAIENNAKQQSHSSSANSALIRKKEEKNFQEGVWWGGGGGCPCGDSDGDVSSICCTEWTPEERRRSKQAQLQKMLI